MEREQFYLDRIKPIYNIAENATSPMLGRKLTEEHKQKISVSNKGENAFWYGKNMSDESKELNRIAHIGKKHTDTTKKVMSEKRKGKYIGKDSPCWGISTSDETKAKMRNAAKKFYQDESKRKEQSDRMKKWWANRKKQ